MNITLTKVLNLKKRKKMKQLIQPIRLFNNPDVIMALTGKAVILNFIAEKSIIVAEHPEFDGNYIIDLGLEADAVFKVLGIDPKEALHSAVFQFSKTQAEALDKLSVFNQYLASIYVENEDRLHTFRRRLGYNDYWKEAFNNHKQSALIDLLKRFEEGMTPDMEAIFVEDHIPATLIADIKSFATPLIEKEATKTSLKGTTKIITADDINAFNAFFKKIIYLCKICKIIFRKDKVKMQMFSYSHIAASMEHHVTKPTPPVPPVNP